MIGNEDSGHSPGVLALNAMSSPDAAPVFWMPKRLGVESAWWLHVPFAHWLVTAIAPRTIVELGTHDGVSYTAFCEAAIRADLSTQCTAIGCWGSSESPSANDESLYWEFKTFHDLHFAGFSRLMREEGGAALQHFADGSIDLLHIDLTHSYASIDHDFSKWLPKLSGRAVVVLHNINVPLGVSDRDPETWKYWHEVTKHYPSFSFVHGKGLGVIVVGSDGPVEVLRLCALTEPSRIESLQERFALIGERWNFESREKALDARVFAGQQTIAHLQRLVKLREDQVQQASEAAEHLRAHGVELEHARSTLHSAVQDHIARGNVLTARIDDLTAHVEALDARGTALQAENGEIRLALETVQTNPVLALKNRLQMGRLR